MAFLNKVDRQDSDTGASGVSGITSRADHHGNMVEDVEIHSDAGPSAGGGDSKSKKTAELSDQEDASPWQMNKQRLTNFYFKYDFPILILLAIGLAKLYPPLGALYLAPQITASWVAVMIMFLLSGLGLKTKEFAKALKKIKFNVFVQLFNFLACSSFVFGISRLLIVSGALDVALADGMLICSCLPLALNTAIILTVAAGGDEAAAVFHTTIGNILGVLVSPMLILMYLGQSGNISLGSIIRSLAICVVVPLVVGLLLQHYIQSVREFFVKYKQRFKKVNEYCLVYVVYTVFCRTFLHKSGASVGNMLLMVLFQFLCMVSLMTMAWYSLKLFFDNQPGLRVMGLFGCTHKTIALGIPLISAIYHGDPNEGLYSLPVLIWHPMALVVGSLVVPRIKKIMANETDRINSKTVGRQSTADLDDDDEESNRKREATIEESSEMKLSSISDEDDADDDPDYGEEKKDETPTEKKLKKLSDDLERSNLSLNAL